MNLEISIIKKVFIYFRAKERRAVPSDQSGHIVVSTPYLRLISLRILRIIFVTLKKRVS